MRYSSLLRTLLISASAAAPLLSPEARAQPAPPAEDLGEVVITGIPYGVTRRATTLAVDVLDQEALSTAPPGTLGDVLNGLPGVRSTAFGAGASRPVIRGMAGPRVLVLSNGVGLIDASGLSPDHQVAAGPGDASRIEVLRGPSTLAYGGTAIGGVVNVIDNRIASELPVDGLEGGLSVQSTSVDAGWSTSADLSAAFGPFVVSLEGQRREAGDYAIPRPAESRRQIEAEGETLETLQGGDLENSFSNLSVYGGGLSWIGSDGFVGVSIRHTDADYGVPGHEAHHDPDADAALVTIGLEQTRYDLRGEWGLSVGPFERIRFSSGYADYEHTEFEGDEAGTQFRSDGWEARAELIQRPADGWRGAFGIQALRRDLDAIGVEAYVPQTRVTEAGIYTLQRLDSGHFGLEGGLRYDSRRLDSLAGARDFQNVSASLGLLFRPTRAWFVGLSLASNGRAPTETELFAEGPHAATRSFEIGSADLGSERAISIEGTLHLDLGSVTADLHLYHARYDGFIDLAPTGAEEAGLPVLSYVQTDATFSGFEAQVAWRVWDAGERRTFSLETSADSVRATTDLGPPARIPPWSVNVRGVLEIDAWTGRIDFREVGQQDRTGAFELPTDGYTTLNAFVSWAPDPDRGLRLYAEARNLNDAEIREHASFLKDLAPSPGRNIRLGVNYRF